MNATEHLARAAEHIKVAESDDSKRAAYIKAQEHIRAAMKANPKLTQKEVAKQVRKSRSWVSELLGWEVHASELPFASKARHAARERSRERGAVPTKHRDKVEMAATLMEDRKVARDAMRKSGKAAVATERALKEGRDNDRRNSRAAREAGATSLRGMVFTVTTKLREWTSSLRAIGEQLDMVPPDSYAHRALVETHRQLAEALHENLVALGVEQPGPPNLEVIDGDAQ